MWRPRLNLGKLARQNIASCGKRSSRNVYLFLMFGINPEFKTTCMKELVRVL
jgi:hypothetical protein